MSFTDYACGEKTFRVLPSEFLLPVNDDSNDLVCPFGDAGLETTLILLIEA